MYIGLNGLLSCSQNAQTTSPIRSLSPVFELVFFLLAKCSSWFRLTPDNILDTNLKIGLPIEEVCEVVPATVEAGAGEGVAGEGGQPGGGTRATRSLKQGYVFS